MLFRKSENSETEELFSPGHVHPLWRHAPAGKKGPFMNQTYYNSPEEALKAHHFYCIKEQVLKGNCPVYENWHGYAGCTMEDFLEKLKWLYEDPLQYPSADLTSKMPPKKSRALLCLWDGNILRLDISYRKNGNFDGFFYHDNELTWKPDKNNPELTTSSSQIKGFRMTQAGKRIEVDTKIISDAENPTCDAALLWRTLLPDGNFRLRNWIL